MEYPEIKRVLNSENKGHEDVTAATTTSSSTSSAGGKETEAAGAGRGDADTTSSGEKDTDGTTKDNPSDDRGWPAPKKAWSKFTKDMLRDKTDFLDEMLRGFDVVDHGNGSLTFNGVLYTIPPEMYTNSPGEGTVLPDGNTTDPN
jgi:hypothetical protein